ncbi:hypothetical protein Patl1_36261 [Pistacia atlantica]|nr:hypothetical protein Patl1_36261 [Pistacia atlantica]
MNNMHLRFISPLRLRWIYFILILLLKLSASTVFSGSIVKYLPGYEGQLPFKLETGYESVGDSELFYYFIESQGDIEEDPLILWLSGGPGCSSFYGLIYEIGPLEFDIHNYTGGLPRLKDYPYAWTKTASIIFLDAPVGTGFSYARTPEGWPTSDSKSAEQSYQFLKKWLLKHPQYLQVELYIGGDSYSGMVVPQITKKIIDENGPDANLRMNLKGYIMGSPHTDSIIDENSKIILAHRMALISDELYQELKTSCKGNYHVVDVSNTRCVAALQTYKNCIKDINRSDILEPKCTYASPHMNQAEMPHRSLQENSTSFILSPPRIPELWCRNFNYALSYMWANDAQVQDALHIRKGFVSDWQRCNKSISYTKDILSVVDINRYLSRYGLQVLIECGDHDMVVPLLGTEQWIKSLNLTIVNDWRPWFVDGQVAGYTQKYSEHGYRLTYATVKASKIQSYTIYRYNLGAGHPALEYYRREGYEMFQRWIHWYPL